MQAPSGWLRSWWTRPCGGRAVLALALPLIISMASWTVMNFTDRMFLLWYSTPSVAAALPAGMLQFTVLCLPLGIASYVNTFVAQYHGAGRPHRMGPAVWQGVWIGLLAAPLFLATIPLAPRLFQLAGHQAEIARQETIYYQVMTCGAAGSVIAGALASFFTGRGVTRVVMLVDSSAALLNVVLDYAWIFGHWGLPELGIAGAAWATVVSIWSRVAIYGLLLARPSYRQTYGFGTGWRVDPALVRRLLRYGGPNGLQLLVEISAFSLFLLLVGRLGEESLAATTLAFNVNSLVFVPMLGLGVALTTLVGQELGQDRPHLAARGAWTSFVLAGAYTGFFALLYVLVPDGLLVGHASHADPEQFARLRPMVVLLLRFVAAYSMFDAMNIVFAGAIKGAGDTRFILGTTLVVSPPPVLAAWLGITYGGLGLAWCWGVLTAWAWCLGVIYLGRFLQGRWRQMRVIEPDVISDDQPLAPAVCALETD